MIKKYTLLLWTICSVMFVSCSGDEDYTAIDEPVLISPVNFDINSVPYQTLSEYNFYEGDASVLEPVYGLVPYTLANTLFSDYSKKKRFIWMPSNVKATYDGDHSPLNFPVGTILIKNFYYDNVLPSGDTRVIETRLMIRKDEGWIFANYVWNEGQTDATLDMSGSFTAFDWEENGETKSVNYRIPAGPECHTCHKSGEIPIPIGPKPRNLNLTYSFEDGVKNQLQKLIDMNYLEDNLPSDIQTMVKWDDTSQPLHERVRSYVDVNCAHCHMEEAHCAYRPIRFNYDSTDEDVNLGICVEPDTNLGQGLSHIVSPSHFLRSVMYYRINSTDESVRMPLLGRTLIHEEGVQLVYDWIESLQMTCE